jgi:ABC-type sugar transport system ATPase subunit
MAFLEVTGLSKKERGRFIVNDIYFVQQPFQKMAIAGETGSGKTTLLKMIAGLVQPGSGEIRFHDKKVIGPYDKLIPGHPKIAYLSQHFELRNNYRVEEELEAVNKLTGEVANEIYHVCRIEHLLKRKTDQLSGGERQRIVLARLLTTSPELLLLDEPFSNLDATHRNIIKTVISDIGEKLKITCILVSHDALDILSWADTILVMKDGQLIQQGTPEYIYRRPVNEYCAGLFGEYNLVSGSDIAGALPGMSLNGQKLLIRPEHFLIAPASHNSLRGIVKEVFFKGSYYSIDVKINKQVIRVQASDDRLQTGDEVWLTVSPDKVWYI